jgi:S1-C subfamily serine protease
MTKTARTLVCVVLIVSAQNSLPRNGAKADGEDETLPEGCLDRRAALADFVVRLREAVDAGKTVGMDPLRKALAEQKRHPVRTPRARRSALKPAKLFERCRKSVVMVGKLHQCGKCDRWHTDVATGFVLHEDGIVATCYHVVGGTEKHKAIAVRTEDGGVYPVKAVLASNKTNDLALLQIDAGDLVPLPIAGHAPVGTQVYCIGHPVKQFYTMTDGMVSRYFRGKDGRAEMAITADFAKGSSGAPVLDETGSVVGIARSTMPVYYEKKDGVGTKVQMVWKQCAPSSVLLDLVR